MQGIFALDINTWDGRHPSNAQGFIILVKSLCGTNAAVLAAYVITACTINPLTG